MELTQKEERLYEIMKGYAKKDICIAFSGGADSSLLLKLAVKCAAPGVRVHAVTFETVLHPSCDLDIAKQVAKETGAIHKIIFLDEFEDERIKKNPKNRCYLCKHELFEKIWEIAKENGMNAVAEGSNMDDNGDYRPGLQAVAELGVTSPLRHSKLAKEEIRILSRNLGLPTWDKQSFACLSSRFVYGEEITREKLSMVDKAEQLLLDLGFHQVRVRIHGMMARIEVEPGEFLKVLENREKITKEFKTYGFTYVTMDLTGYRTGSMNETLGE